MWLSGLIQLVRTVKHLARARARHTGTPVVQLDEVAHPAGTRWGDLISEERKTDLEALMVLWEALNDRDRRARVGPFERDNGDELQLLSAGFHRVRLNGADVFWLSMRAYVNLTFRNINIARDDAFRKAERVFHDPHMRELVQGNTMHLDLRGANLSGADLKDAYLPHADMRHTNLEGAHLEGADLSYARLEDTRLKGAFFDHGTDLDGTHFNRAWLHGTVFGDADISVVPWAEVQRLGDEVGRKAAIKKYKERAS